MTQQQQQWPIFEKNPWLQVRKSSIIPLIHDRLEFGLKQRRWKDSRDLLDVLDFLNNTWSKSYWRANKFFTLDNCLLVNNFFIRCCLKNLTHQANPRSPSAFSASNQIPIGHVLTELLKIFLPEVGGFFQMSVIVVVVVSRDSPPWKMLSSNQNARLVQLFTECKRQVSETKNIFHVFFTLSLIGFFFSLFRTKF